MADLVATHRKVRLYSMLDSYSAFVFDLDGTLIDSEKYHVKAFAQAMLDMGGHHLTAAEEREFTGNTSLDLARDLADRYGLDICPAEVAHRKFELLYDVFRTEAFPHVEQFLRACAGRWRLAVASNSPLHFVERALDDLGVSDLFGVVTTIDDVSRRKPDPEIVLLTLDRLGLSPESCLVFEDSLPGVQAAVAAGCDVVVLRNPGLILPESLPTGTPVQSWEELLTLAGEGQGAF
ncbi:MAG: HAD family phosphatase [Lentisphaerae bacterium]|nr:HAD family phosphatase [Lentisphaerota bacterium]MBT4817570.1 HAD family phosphatase [Lentisphaerota bacterium]MBT5608515.1 HAD family phosphatase [Lentisphaerota bacterium]MBT7058523.1 HAD family phosphatase [Lentisphaerota bacterium]MBT7843232.1 HAD family phosphatase [Lentisphaerota bacterium]